jgi:hypothetical protein
MSKENQSNNINFGTITPQNYIFDKNFIILPQNEMNSLLNLNISNLKKNLINNSKLNSSKFATKANSSLKLNIENEKTNNNNINFFNFSSNKNSPENNSNPPKINSLSSKLFLIEYSKSKRFEEDKKITEKMAKFSQEKNIIYEENNNNNNNKVLINLYCQNQNLSLISPKIRDLISTLQNYSINNDDKFQNKIYIQFLEKLGFYPNKKISNYEIKYNLYDFTDQCLIYHLYLNHIQERHLDESTLVMIFDKENIHITALNKGAIFHKFKAFEKNWNAKYYSLIKYDDMESINNFIQAMSGSTGGLDLVLCSINNEEKKEEFENKFKQIKEFIEENVEERIRLFVYYEDMFIVDILKYIETFSDE